MEILSAFPQSIIGAMLLMVGIEFVKFLSDVKKTDLFLIAFTAGLALLTNMAVGFITVILLYHGLRRWAGNKQYTRWFIGG